MDVTNINENSIIQQDEPAAQAAAAKETKYRRFIQLGIPGFLYAVFYTFCLYRNASGITHPFFVAGTLYFYYYCLKKLGIPLKKDAVYYMAATVLLGISIFLTDDIRIINMNKLGIFILMISFLLHQCYEDEGWGFTHYLYAIVRTVFGALGAFFTPYADFCAVCALKYKDKKNHTRLLSIVIGLSISFPLLYVILALLSSADMIFDRIFTEYVWDFLWRIHFAKHFWGVLWSIIAGLLIGYSLFSFIREEMIIQNEKNRRTGEPLIAITFTSLLSVVYILFCLIQIAGLFLGHMTLPDGFTYSEYARQGFFQLLFVCVINLSLVLICLAFFKENRILKILLTLISSCTYIMIISSAMRMALYIKAYGLTFLRIFVLWALVVIFLLMTGIIISIYQGKFPLFRYSMMVVTILYIALSFSRPDYFIAKYNVHAGKTTGNEYYLYHLSADAAPILLNQDIVTPDSVDYYLSYRETMTDYDIGVRTFNVSRYLAQRRL